MDMKLTLLQISILGAIIVIIAFGLIYIISDNRAHNKEMKRRAEAKKARRREKELA